MKAYIKRRSGILESAPRSARPRAEARTSSMFRRAESGTLTRASPGSIASAANPPKPCGPVRNTTLGLTCTRRAVSQEEKEEDVVTRAEEDENGAGGGEGWESGRFIVGGFGEVAYSCHACP